MKIKILNIILIVYILFISLFALDAFADNQSLSQNLISLLIHLIPSFLVIIACLIANKNNLVGGSLLIVIGLAFSIFFKVNFPIFLLICLPLIIIGSLFLYHHN